MYYGYRIVCTVWIDIPMAPLEPIWIHQIKTTLYDTCIHTYVYSRQSTLNICIYIYIYINWPNDLIAPCGVLELQRWNISIGSGHLLLAAATHNTKRCGFLPTSEYIQEEFYTQRESITQINKPSTKF